MMLFEVSAWHLTRAKMHEISMTNKKANVRQREDKRVGEKGGERGGERGGREEYETD